MVILNRVLNVLIFVLAIVTLLFGFLLFNRRVELRDRGEKLADAVAEIVKDLDTESGTAYQGEINRDDYVGADQKKKPGGKLGWAYFHEIRDKKTKSYQKFDNILDEVKKQAKDVREQRDMLANAISEYAKLFEADGDDKASYQQIATYEESLVELKNNFESVRDRNDEIIVKIEEIANKIEFPLDKDVLKDNEQFKVPLTNLGFHASKLKERMVNYADTLSDAVNKIDSHDFEASVDLLVDDNEYLNQLTAIRNDFASINDKLKEYDKYKITILEKEQELERTIEALEATNENLATLEGKLANIESDYARLNKRYTMLVGDTSKTGTTQLKKVEGKVLNVNYDWSYVIIDLGKEDNLPENLELIVAREGEYICKVLVTRVFKNYAIAEILPKVKLGNIIEGDRVIF
jgi:DNA repair exonuclease SbcCD ATPase subunit